MKSRPALALQQRPGRRPATGSPSSPPAAARPDPPLLLAGRARLPVSEPGVRRRGVHRVAVRRRRPSASRRAAGRRQSSRSVGSSQRLGSRWLDRRRSPRGNDATTSVGRRRTRRAGAGAWRPAGRGTAPARRPPPRGRRFRQQRVLVQPARVQVLGQARRRTPRRRQPDARRQRRDQYSGAERARPGGVTGAAPGPARRAARPGSTGPRARPASTARAASPAPRPRRTAPRPAAGPGRRPAILEQVRARPRPARASWSARRRAASRLAQLDGECPAAARSASASRRARTISPGRGSVGVLLLRDRPALGLGVAAVSRCVPVVAAHDAGRPGQPLPLGHRDRARRRSPGPGRSASARNSSARGRSWSASCQHLEQRPGDGPLVHRPGAGPVHLDPCRRQVLVQQSRVRRRGGVQHGDPVCRGGRQRGGHVSDDAAHLVVGVGRVQYPASPSGPAAARCRGPRLAAGPATAARPGRLAGRR